MQAPTLGFIQSLPKAELHVHIEGTLEPELMLTIADRNKVPTPYRSIEDVRAAYNFKDLQAFLDIYHLGCSVLMYEKDFYELMHAYLEKAALQGVRYAEIFFIPQIHMKRGVDFPTFMHGFTHAMADAKRQFGIHSNLILSFVRALPEQEALETLALALPYREHIIGVGLEDAERNNPPDRFANAFAQARNHGFSVTAHAGEEGPAAYIWQALDILHVSRIDHGVHCVQDPRLVAYLAEKQIPLTMCPISNVKLNVVPDLAHHPLKHLLELGLCVTVNSDDPAFFGAYIAENYHAAQVAMHLSKGDLYQLAKNSFIATFLTHEERRKYLRELEAFFVKHSS